MNIGKDLGDRVSKLHDAVDTVGRSVASGRDDTGKCFDGLVKTVDGVGDGITAVREEATRRFGEIEKAVEETGRSVVDGRDDTGRRFDGLVKAVDGVGDGVTAVREEVARRFGELEKAAVEETGRSVVDGRDDAGRRFEGLAKTVDGVVDEVAAVKDGVGGQLRQLEKTTDEIGRSIASGREDAGRHFDKLEKTVNALRRSVNAVEKRAEGGFEQLTQPVQATRAELGALWTSSSRIRNNPKEGNRWT